MAHIELPEGMPGIRGPLAFSPETAKPLSARNDCTYCHTSHGAIAAHDLAASLARHGYAGLPDRLAAVLAEARGAS